jgi:hypothetical protein
MRRQMAAWPGQAAALQAVLQKVATWQREQTDMPGRVKPHSRQAPIQQALCKTNLGI